MNPLHDRYRPKGVLPQRCSADFWRIAILTDFWRILDVPLFPVKQDSFLTHFWRILAIADAFSENTFWTIPTWPTGHSIISESWEASNFKMDFDTEYRCYAVVSWTTTHFGETLRGNTIGATGPRASEREMCLWEGLFSEVFRGFLEGFRDF